MLWMSALIELVHIALVEFFKTQVGKIEHEVDSHMPSGFQIVFLAMLKEAKVLALDLLYQLPLFNQIMEKRGAKLKRLLSHHDYPLLLRKLPYIL